MCYKISLESCTGCAGPRHYGTCTSTQLHIVTVQQVYLEFSCTGIHTLVAGHHSQRFPVCPDCHHAGVCQAANLSITETTALQLPHLISCNAVEGLLAHPHLQQVQQQSCEGQCPLIRQCSFDEHACCCSLLSLHLLAVTETGRGPLPYCVKAHYLTSKLVVCY